MMKHVHACTESKLIGKVKVVYVIVITKLQWNGDYNTGLVSTGMPTSYMVSFSDVTTSIRQCPFSR